MKNINSLLSVSGFHIDSYGRTIHSQTFTFILNKTKSFRPKYGDYVFVTDGKTTTMVVVEMINQYDHDLHQFDEEIVSIATKEESLDYLNALEPSLIDVQDY